MKQKRYLLTNKEQVMIKHWTSKQSPESIRQNFNLDLYWKIKKYRHDNKINIGNIL